MQVAPPLMHVVNKSDQSELQVAPLTNNLELNDTPAILHLKTLTKLRKLWQKNVHQLISFMMEEFMIMISLSILVNCHLYCSVFIIIVYHCLGHQYIIMLSMTIYHCRPLVIYLYQWSYVIVSGHLSVSMDIYRQVSKASGHHCQYVVYIRVNGHLSLSAVIYPCQWSFLSGLINHSMGGSRVG